MLLEAEKYTEKNKINLTDTDLFLKDREIITRMTVNWHVDIILLLNYFGIETRVKYITITLI